MREIKFRGKRVDNGEWVYGDLMHYEGEVFVDDCPRYAVIPESVGQYVEEYDYYEGDVIEAEIIKFFGMNKMLCAYHGVVEFKNSKFQIHCIEDDHYYPLNQFTGCVVDNIHDNPSFLGVQP